MPANEKWFANKGQILQIVLGVAGLAVASVKAWPDLTNSKYLSGGALLFYILVGLVLFSVWRLVKEIHRTGASSGDSFTQLEATFNAFRVEISAMMTSGEDGRKRCHLICSDHLATAHFQTACETAVRTVRAIHRLKRSLPKEVRKEEYLCAWLSILDHFDLRERSLAEHLYPNSPPPRERVFKKVSYASAIACQKLKALL